MRKLILSLLLPFILLMMPMEAHAEQIEDEVMYYMIVDRFNIGDHQFSKQVRVNDPYAYQGGDLLGITKRLDYLMRFGYTTIILSPIMANAPDGYHGYWIEDFYRVEEEFGTMDDLHHLIEEAHKRDMKVILELVTNYVSETHPFASDPDKQHWFKDEVQFERTPSTTWLDHVKVLDQEEEEVITYLLDVAHYWLSETDIDGYKINDADRSAPAFISRLTESLKETYPDKYILAGCSVSCDDIEALKNLDTIDAIEDRDWLEQLVEILAKPGEFISDLNVTDGKNGPLPILALDHQDSARFTSLFKAHGRGTLNAWELALTYLYTIPGVPVIYQGSEIPMYGEGFPENQRLVQFNNQDPDLEEVFHRLSSLRSSFPVLTKGDYEPIGNEDGMSVFKRTYGDETAYIAINNDIETKSIMIDDLTEDLQLRGMLGDNLVRENNDGYFIITLDRETVEVFMVEENTGINWPFVSFVILVFAIFIIGINYLSYKERQRKKAEAKQSVNQ